MKEHEDDVVKSTVAVGSSVTGGFFSEKDLGEDVVVDVVGSDVVEEFDFACAGVSFEDFVWKESENHDQDMVDVVGAGAGAGCDVSVGIKVLSSENDEVLEVAGSGEGGDASVETSVLITEKVQVIVNEAVVSKDILQGDDVVTVASGSNGDVAVIGSKEVTERGLTEEVVKVHVESVEELTDRKILGSHEVDMVVEDSFAEDGVSVDPRLVCGNSQSSAAEGVSSRTDEVDESRVEDSLHPTSVVITDDAQKTTDGNRVVNEKIEKENEVLVSSKISEPLTSMNSGSEDVDMVVVVEDGLVVKDKAQDEINVRVENVDHQDEVDKLSEKESFHPATEVVTETDIIVENEEIMKQPTETVQDVAYGNGVMDKKTGKENEILDSLEIPEAFTIVNLGPEEVNDATLIADTVKNPVSSCEVADMDRGEDAVMDIDEVPGIDVTSGAEKDQHFNITANLEANVEQKLPGSSSGPVLIQHREEHTKSREPIVYGRRAHVDVPVYESLDIEQKLPESSSPISEDEHLKIETDSEEDDDYSDDESVQEDKQKADRQNQELLENGNLLSLDQSSYFKPPSNEGEFAVSDLVWGKVRSHPWWPGQIIDPSIASNKAMKYYKKDSFLVAYFGDHSFAWNNSSVLKPLRANFSQTEKQTEMEIFKIAVNCALEEVTRRAELGLACFCVPKEIHKKIEYQVIENAGVRTKSNKRHGKDESASVSSFEPDKLLNYVRLLAQFPDQGDKMDLAITKAQLSSYGHYKGYRELHEFWVCGGDLLEDAPVDEKVEQVYKNGEQFEQDLVESANANKEISLSGITNDAPESVAGTSKLVSLSGLKKRKARVYNSNGSVKRPNRPPSKVAAAPISPAPTPTPKPSFKVGALIQRVASQLTEPVVKSGSDLKVEHNQHADQIVQTPENPQTEASVAEMLSQLHLTAQDPMKEYSFFQTIIPFFYERRAAVFSKSLKKTSPVVKPDSGTKTNPPNENDTEEFEFDFDFDFDDVNDSYWTDRIIQNQSEDQPLQDIPNGVVEEYAVVEHEPAKKRRRSNKKQKHVLACDHEPGPEPKVEEESEVVRKRRENLATEVVLKFEEGISFCSEIQLNKMFRRFGSLMESETEVDRQGGRARVVFKKCSDAEVAHSSAERFNIFGSINVGYELNYNPLVSYKPLPLPLLQEDQMDES